MQTETQNLTLLSSSFGGGEEEAIKALVKEKYAQIANQSFKENATSCCGGYSILLWR